MSPLKRASTPVPEPKTVRETSVEDLQGTELFHDAPEEIIKGIRRSSRICSLKPNQRLFTTRKNKDFLYVVVKGYVAIWIPSCFDPDQEVFVAWRGPHNVLGELRSVGAEQSKTRINTCDECEFIEIKLGSFLVFAGQDSSLYRNMANLLWRKMLIEGHRSEVVQMTSVKRKVAQSLIHLVQDRCGEDVLNSKTEFEIPGTMRQSEIAAYAGIPRRETVNRELKELRSRGLIAYSRKKGARGSQIIILDLPALRRSVEAKAENDQPANDSDGPGNDLLREKF